MSRFPELEEVLNNWLDELAEEEALLKLVENIPTKH